MSISREEVCTIKKAIDAIDIIRKQVVDELNVEFNLEWSGDAFAERFEEKINAHYYKLGYSERLELAKIVSAGKDDIYYTNVYKTIERQKTNEKSDEELDVLSMLQFTLRQNMDGLKLLKSRLEQELQEYPAKKEKYLKVIHGLDKIYSSAHAIVREKKGDQFGTDDFLPVLDAELRQNLMVADTKIYYYKYDSKAPTGIPGTKLTIADFSLQEIKRSAYLHFSDGLYYIAAEHDVPYQVDMDNKKKLALSKLSISSGDRLTADNLAEITTATGDFPHFNKIDYSKLQENFGLSAGELVEFFDLSESVGEAVSAEIELKNAEEARPFNAKNSTFTGLLMAVDVKAQLPRMQQQQEQEHYLALIIEYIDHVKTASYSAEDKREKLIIAYQAQVELTGKPIMVKMPKENESVKFLVLQPGEKPVRHNTEERAKELVQELKEEHSLVPVCIATRLGNFEKCITGNRTALVKGLNPTGLTILGRLLAAIPKFVAQLVTGKTALLSVGIFSNKSHGAALVEAIGAVDTIKISPAA